MAKYEVSKTFEAAKLNKRTGSPLNEHPVTIPYGAILDNVEEDVRYRKFSYLGDRYQIKLENAAGTMQLLARTGDAPMKLDEEETDAKAPASTSGSPAAVADTRPVLAFEGLRVSGGPALSRARVPGGWLVAVSGGVTFVPDENHAWDGGTHS